MASLATSAIPMNPFNSGHGLTNCRPFISVRMHPRKLDCARTKRKVFVSPGVASDHSRHFERRKSCIQLPNFKSSFAVASLAFFLSSYPVQAGVLSGFPGLESVPPPEIMPRFEFLKRIQEESRKRSEASDSKFKSSPLLQELLKRSKDNYKKNKQEIEDKYCERGAEWGVGNCSTVGMSPEERDEFMEMLRKRRQPN
eukprot:TRINITY_DN33523_c0_g1_i1.p1 TRINITY_DN33523_c0_g1~~TRINITY_DN33523_c0_g1_i1.p1  ORF type:complete len:198 (+),score=31.17 TRINITY_DN33523_c0_g1_i1:119-712(+)